MSENIDNPLPKPRHLRVMICAGEVSGDMYGSAIMRALRAQTGRDIEFFGIGGDRMRAEGAELFAHTSDISVIGIWEVLKRLRFFLRLLATLKGLLASRKPDMLLTIDYPGMNMKLLAEAKRLGIKTAHYVCPQVWAWHKERIPKIAECVDKLVCLFPFEPKLFSSTRLRPDFVGHPLVDSFAEESENDTTIDWGKGHRIAIFAGSRRNEVQRILPTILAGAKIAEEKLGKCSFMLPTTSEDRWRDIEEVLNKSTEKPSNVRLVHGHSGQVLREAEAAVVKSGTSTLVAALAGCPFFVVYKISPLTFAIARRIVKGVRHIGLVNIVPGREVCRELVQHQLSPAAVCDELVRLINDSDYKEAQLRGLRDVRELLGEKGAIDRAAQIFADFLLHKEHDV